jgi:hypothetical protein
VGEPFQLTEVQRGLVKEYCKQEFSSLKQQAANHQQAVQSAKAAQDNLNAVGGAMQQLVRFATACGLTKDDLEQ